MFLLRQTVPLQQYKPRIYLNGFPKAGLHLIEQLVKPLLSKSSVGHQGNEWLGMFKWHSWTNEMIELRPFLWRLSCLERGNYVKGHLGYDSDIERLMYYANIGQIFICRDFRDVAVSQAHHIWDTDMPTLEHAHRDVYRMLGSFDEVLSACITGMGPYPGIMERWEMYHGWLKTDWVLKVKYEDIVSDMPAHAGAIFLYCIRNATQLLDGEFQNVDCTEETYRELVGLMVESANKHDESTTFRKGLVGNWRTEFKQEHVDLFKQRDTKNWLIRLGYEQDQEWSL